MGFVFYKSVCNQWSKLELFIWLYLLMSIRFTLYIYCYVYNHNYNFNNSCDYNYNYNHNWKLHELSSVCCKHGQINCLVFHAFQCLWKLQHRKKHFWIKLYKKKNTRWAQWIFFCIFGVNDLWNNKGVFHVRIAPIKSFK